MNKQPTNNEILIQLAHARTQTSECLALMDELRATATSQAKRLPRSWTGYATLVVVQYLVAHLMEVLTHLQSLWAIHGSANGPKMGKSGSERHLYLQTSFPDDIGEDELPF